MFDHEMRDGADRVLQACRSRGLKVVTAESCTGGLVAATLTAIAGSSDVVDRAFVTYADWAQRCIAAALADSAPAPTAGALPDTPADDDEAMAPTVSLNARIDPIPT